MKYFVVAYKAKSEKLLPQVFNNPDDAFQFARLYLARYKRVKKCEVKFLGAYAIQTYSILLCDNYPFAKSNGDDLPF